MVATSSLVSGHPQYRPDIDGLRAIAILTVLLFHLGVSAFSGGYIGVDVFFVISGYLITKLIRDEVSATEKFSFSNFYIRRVRRLFPSLVFTLCLTLVAAAFLFSAQFFERFGASLLHALFSLSNFYFWKNSDYFAPAAELEPLLHTWSLSVEEQFYLLWPITLVLLLKKSSGVRFGILLIIFAMSLALTRYYIHQTSMIFYLLPFRVFEFIIGALMVWIVEGKSSRNWIDECMTAIGLILIFFAATTYTSSEPFPSFEFREFTTKRPGFMFLDPYDALCDSNHCHVVKDGQLYYSDHAHLTVSGADIVVTQFRPELMRVVSGSRGEVAARGY